MLPVERQEIIDRLVSCFLNTCENDKDFLHSILRVGWRGFEEMDNNELIDYAKEYLP